MAGIAVGAEAVVIPEHEVDPEEIAGALRAAYTRGKAHAVVVVAEGAQYNARRLAACCEAHHERLGFELRVPSLGHIQRGGTPGACDRLLASRCGAAAVDHLAVGGRGVLVLLRGGAISSLPLDEVVVGRRTLDPSLLELTGILAR